MTTVRITRFFLSYWLAMFIVMGGILNTLPFFAPVAMRLGWTDAGNAIYTIYAPLCHQMAQRSFFLFGSETMYDVDQLPVELKGIVAEDMLSLRRFAGNNEFGWKVAWSDRMVYLYGSVWLAGMVYWFLSRRWTIKSIPLWLFTLLVVPMILDGVTHVISDYSGLTAGFRYNNTWLVDLTANALSDRFYRGDTFGSFNSWMRLLSGGLFGVACAALALPIIDEYLRRSNRILARKIQRRNDMQRFDGGVEMLRHSEC